MMEDYNRNAVEYVKVIAHLTDLFYTGNADLAFQLMKAFEFNAEDVEYLFNQLFKIAFKRISFKEIAKDFRYDWDDTSWFSTETEFYDLSFTVKMVNFDVEPVHYISELKLTFNKFSIELIDDYDIEIDNDLTDEDINFSIWSCKLVIKIEDYIEHCYYYTNILRFIHHYNQLTNG